MNRTLCGSCGSDLHVVLDLGYAPLADEFPTEPDLPTARYPLQMAICHNNTCRLAQLVEVVDDQILWGGDYAFYAGAAQPVVEYMARYADWLASNYSLLGHSGLTVEVGCNDGTLLAPLRDRGLHVLGVDPAGGPVEAARAKRLHVLHRPFGKQAAQEILDRRGWASLIIANNVAAHVADLDDFFTAIKQLLTPQGVAILEVQYLPDLLLGNDFTLLYHEHRFYFSLTSLAAAAALRDLDVRNAWYTSPQGGSLRVEITHMDAPGHPAPVVAAIRRRERSLEFGGLQDRADRLRESILDLVFAEHAAGRTVAGYGASAKASTLLAWTGLDRISPPKMQAAGVHEGSSQGISWVLDTTPTKIGRYMPGTAIPVVASHDPPDTYLLMIWNYLGHIIRKEADFLATGGRMILPFPKPVVL